MKINEHKKVRTLAIGLSYTGAFGVAIFLFIIKLSAKTINRFLEAPLLDRILLYVFFAIFVLGLLIFIFAHLIEKKTKKHQIQKNNKLKAFIKTQEDFQYNHASSEEKFIFISYLLYLSLFEIDGMSYFERKLIQNNFTFQEAKEILKKHLIVSQEIILTLEQYHQNKIKKMSHLPSNHLWVIDADIYYLNLYLSKTISLEEYEKIMESKNKVYTALRQYRFYIEEHNQNFQVMREEFHLDSGWISFPIGIFQDKENAIIEIHKQIKKIDH